MSDFLPATPSEWKVARLSDVANFQNGHAFYKDGYSEEGLIAIDLYNVDEEGRLRFGERDKHVSPEHCERFSKFKLNRNDLVMVMTDMTQRLGILGKCAVIDQNDRYILNQRLGRVTANESVVLTRYLHYFINSEYFLTPLRALAKGAVQKYVNTGDIKDNRVLIPPLPVQRRIAGILSTYDDLIVNNTRRIAVLEEMARRLYEEWFVHFRFPGHEQVRMVESELGLIPEGWRIVSASDAIAINPSTKVPKDGVKPFVPMNCLANHSMLITNHEMREGNSGSKFMNGDTLFARITPCLENGKTGYVQFLGPEQPVAFGSTEFIVLRSRTLNPEFVYTMARSDTFRETAIKSMSGASGRQRVRDACFNTFQFAHPDVESLKQFSEAVRPMFKLAQTLSIKNTNLRTQRDLLLPKLISGELDVSAFPEPEAVAA